MRLAELEVMPIFHQFNWDGEECFMELNTMTAL